MTDVEVRGLRAGYAGIDVLEGIDLHVPSGSLAAILGESGSGKTTLLRVLAGFLRPTSGEVLLGDRLVCGPNEFVPPEKRHVGIVPQEGALFPHLDVRGNIAFGLPRGSNARVDEVLELVGLTGMGQARPQELSGGQQQRVALARALAPQPQVVLLDEPFTALDAGLRARLRTDVRDVLRQVGTTAILVTHDQEEALSMADIVAVMRDGRLIQTGVPHEIYGSPTDLAVARFVGDVVEVPVLEELADDRVRCGLGDITVGRTITETDATGIDVVVLRPEQLMVTPVRDDGHAHAHAHAHGDVVGTSPDGSIGRVQSTRYHGHDAMVTVLMNDGSEIDVRVTGVAPPRVGDQVVVSVTGAARRYRSAAHPVP
jgi:iron(III) transport system ATP-binding protein